MAATPPETISYWGDLEYFNFVYSFSFSKKLQSKVENVLPDQVVAEATCRLLNILVSQTLITLKLFSLTSYLLLTLTFVFLVNGTVRSLKYTSLLFFNSVNNSIWY